jgi:SAM-dependent methyltransferase
MSEEISFAYGAEWKDDLSGENLKYLRVGNRLFIDSDLRHFARVFLNEKNAVIYFDKTEDIASDRVSLRHSGLTMAALDYVDISGEHVLDLGCGKGMLSLVAYNKKARKITSVDRDSTLLNHFKENCDTNGMDLSKFNFVQGNITSDHFPDQLPLEDITVVCANLGNGQYDGKPDKAALRLLDNLPNVRCFIGGGYAANDEHGPGQEVADLIYHKGFKISWLRSTAGRDDQHLISFIARKA